MTKSTEWPIRCHGQMVNLSQFSLRKKIPSVELANIYIFHWAIMLSYNLIQVLNGAIKVQGLDSGNANSTISTLNKH